MHVISQKNESFLNASFEHISLPAFIIYLVNLRGKILMIGIAK